MGESRQKRRARLDAVETELLGATARPAARREKGSLRSGFASRAGDAAVATLLEEALRCHGPVERATHGFHTYPAGLHPDAAKLLLTLGEGPVLDPFCGGGTVLVEAMLAGRDALGLDVGSVACLVARARTLRTDEERRTKLRSLARKAAAEARSATGAVRVEPAEWPLPIRRAYEPHVVAELDAIRRVIGTDEALRAVFSAILVKVSKRESDTRNQLTEQTRPVGTTATLFHAKAREYARMLAPLEAEGVGTARVHREDAREFRAKAPFGLVLTSPPYPGVYDYLPMQALRRWWLGLDDDRAFRDEIGARRNFRADRATAIAAWKDDTRAWLRATAKALAPGGRLVAVVGDGLVGEVRIDAWTPLDTAAREAGLRFVSRVSIERLDEARRAPRPEHAGVWEKPAA